MLSFQRGPIKLFTTCYNSVNEELGLFLSQDHFINLFLMRPKQFAQTTSLHDHYGLQ